MNKDAVVYLDQGAETTDKAISPDQVRNSDGKFVFKVNDMDRLRRFICFGSEGNNYYVGPAQLNRENTQNIARLIERSGVTVVNELAEFSKSGRAAKRNNLIYALAMCARLGDDATKNAAYKAMPYICRSAPDLIKFVGFCKHVMPNTKGWGRGMRKAVKSWYTNRKPRDIAYQITKYPQRKVSNEIDESYSHKDLLYLAHVKPDDEVRNLVFRYAAKGFNDEQFQAAITAPAKDAKGRLLLDESNRNILVKDTDDALILIDAVNRLKSCNDPKEAAKLITEYGLVHEHVPSEIKNRPEVWEALLQNMPVRAMIWNLGRMTSYGLLGRNSDTAKKVVDELSNLEQLKYSRIHPYTAFVASKAYSSGRSRNLNWAPNPQITDVLSNVVLPNSFQYVQSSGKRFMISVDVSPSMWGGYGRMGVWEGRVDRNGRPVYSEHVVAAEAAAVNALALAKAEPQHVINAFAGANASARFSKRGSLSDLNIYSGQRLEDTLKTIKAMSEGLTWTGTDCSLPMRHALENKIPVDAFIVCTDNETNALLQPVVQLQRYRDAMGIDAKLIVIAFSSTGFTIADPNDNGMMDIAGWDSAAPRMITEFVSNRI